MVARDCEDTLDDHAKFPSVYDPRVFGDNSETSHYWDFDLAGDEYWLPFPPDAVGVLYPVATLDRGDHWVYRDGNTCYCVSGGGVDTFGRAEISSLPAEVREGLVGICHAVNVVALLDGGTDAVISINDFGGKLLAIGVVLGV